MPDVHFIGELSCATGMSVGCVSVTWALVPGTYKQRMEINEIIFVTVVILVAFR